MKEWFPHDASAHADAKLLQLLAHSKCYYACYWLTLEWLFMMDDATASMSEYQSLSYHLHETKDDTELFVNFCISLGLFIKTETIFYSERLKTQKKRQMERSAAMSANAKLWHSRSISNGSKRRGEKSRVEKKKEEKSEEALDAPTPADKVRDFFEHESSREAIIQKIIKSGWAEPTVRTEVKKFCEHWTERNKSGKKQAWELKPTFELRKRLATWFNNFSKFSSPSHVA